MEKKTTQRIIGVLVIIALVIILLPLMIGKNDVPVQTASIQTLPVPDQLKSSNEVATKATIASSKDKSDAKSAANIMPSEMASHITKAASKDKQSAADHVEQVASESIVKAKSDIVNAFEIKEDTIEVADESKDEATQEDNAAQKIVKTAAKESHPAKMKVAASSNADAKSIARLKKSMWVVQLGSFKEKENARRLADKLRAAGFKAFMHDVKSAKGSKQTRVYIGPESKQASASQLSTQLQEQMKMSGIVVSYQPLEL